MLRSALQDLRETTLAAVSGLLAKLAYLSSLRHGYGAHHHWGMAQVYGSESSERALRTAHAEVLAGVLRAPLESLMEDLQESSRSSGISAQPYVAEMQNHFEDLLPAERTNSPAASHLNSVLVALSNLEKARVRATRSAS